MAAEIGFDNGDADHGWGGIRLSTGLVAGWKVGGVCDLSERCDGVVAAGCGERENACVDERWRGECGAAVVARWEEDCLDFDGVSTDDFTFLRRMWWMAS